MTLKQIIYGGLGGMFIGVFLIEALCKFYVLLMG